MFTRAVKRLEALLGRTTTAQPDLDGLLRLRDGAGLLAAAAGMRPTGDGALALRPARPDRFVQMFAAVNDLITRPQTRTGATIELRALDEGVGPYQWVTARGDRLEDLVAAVHSLGSGLQERGFGTHLFTAAFSFATTPDGDTVLVLYVFGRGTFYPLARTGDRRRDHALELGVRGAIAPMLPPEDDRAHRLPVTEVPLP